MYNPLLFLWNKNHEIRKKERETNAIEKGLVLHSNFFWGGLGGGIAV